MGESTQRFIIHETCRAIWDVLKDVAMNKPTKKEWSNKAHIFWERCNLTNCVRAIDGKHIWILKPVASGYYISPLYYWQWLMPTSTLGPMGAA